ncbi:MAG: Mobile element protein, partial [uncultured Rubrobacteraceae bacterium]
VRKKTVPHRRLRRRVGLRR